MATPLIGRHGELDELDRLVRAAAAGAGGLAVVEGEAGIGKTALLDELTRRVVASSGVVLRGAAWEAGGAPPYWPWREIADAGGWPVRWMAHDDPFTLYQWVAAAARRTAATTADGPLVLIVDDLHAADDDSIRLTRYLARTLADAAVAIVVATRPSDRLAALTRLGTLVLPGPLSDADADAVVAALGAGTLDAATSAAIVSAAEGNPLFLRELTRAGRTGRPVPSDLLSAIAPALDSLTDAARELVEIAAVFGRSVTIQRLSAASGRSVSDVVTGLEPIRRSGVLVIDGSPLRVSFSHQVVRDIVYEGVPPARRLALHASAAAVIADERVPGSITEQARHLLAAVPVVPPEQASTVARRAADAARAATAFGDAAELRRRCIALVPAVHDLVALHLDLGRDLRAAGHVTEASDAFDAAIVAARGAGSPTALATAVLERTELVGWGAPAEQLVPLLDDAIASLAPDTRTTVGAGGGDRAAIDAAPGAGAPSAWRVRLQARRAALSATGTDLDRASADAREALDAARALDLGSERDAVLADALSAAHRCCWRPDRLADSLELGQEMVSVARRLGDADRLSEALLAELIDHLRAGDMRAAERDMAGYEAFSARSGHPRHRFFALSRRAMLAFLHGRLAEGELLIEQAYELGQQIEEPDALQVFHGARMVVIDLLQEPDETMPAARYVEDLARNVEPRLNVHAAHALLRAGAVDDARAAIERLREALPALTLAHLSLFDLCLVAEVAAAVRHPAIAGALADALAPYAGCVVVNAGAVTFGGVVDEYLGMLADALGQSAAAQGHLAAAVERYRTLGAPTFEERARRAASVVGAMDGDGPAERADVATASGPAGRSAVFRRRGDHWEIGLDGRVAVVRDARGLHHVHALLTAAGREIAATDLAGPQAAELAAREARHALLDDTAKVAYRRRVQQLHTELDRADAAGDVERSVRTRAELDALLGELRRAVGLGGRDRASAATSERARVTVRKAIAAAVDRIAQHDPPLAYLLRGAVRTGHLCAYDPDPGLPVVWELT